MNKQKIKELVLSTGEAEYDWRETLLFDDEDALVEKLIEVVVRECISVLEKKIYKSIDNEGDEIWADLILNKHFGVK